MRLVSPIVIKIAETAIVQENWDRLLSWIGPEAEAWYRTRIAGDWGMPFSAEALTEICGRICYKSFGTELNPNLTQVRPDRKSFIRNIIEKGDGSIFEHSTVTFAVLYCSRVFTHELVRHRAGMSFSQESLRFVRITDLPIVNTGHGVNLSEEYDKSLYNSMTEAMRSAEKAYQKLNDGVDWDHMSFDEKKRLTSWLRRALPQGMATNIIFTANNRALRWLIEMHTNPAAEMEIRQIFGTIADICLQDYPLLYQDMEMVSLSDGTKQYSFKLRSKL